MNVQLETVGMGVDAAVLEAATSHPERARPAVVEIRTLPPKRPDPGEGAPAPPSAPDTRNDQGDLDPLKVFTALVTSRQGTLDPALEDVFRRLLTLSPEAVAEQVIALTEAPL